MSNIKACLVSCMLVGVSIGLPVHAGEVTRNDNALRVDQDAAPGGDGLSWETAFRSLQDALAAADGRLYTEIWVAEGTYRPDDGLRQTPGDRDATFLMRPGVGVYGGFLGVEIARSQRNPEVNLTLLSGDLAGNDGSSGNQSDNSKTVVTANVPNSGAGTVLDGFTIEAAYGGSEGDCGGGLLVDGAGLIVRGVTFHDNTADKGGGLCIKAGGLPQLYDCRFEHNDANYGGAIYAEPQTGLSASRTWIIGNAARSGGAFYGEQPFIWVTNCFVAGNHASGYGGGFHFNGGLAYFTNTVFSGNEGGHGGAIYLSNGAETIITNGTFSANIADLTQGGAVLASTAGDVIVNNGVFWGNQDTNGNGETSQITPVGATVLDIDYSIVQGWTGMWGGTGNTGLNPLFADADGADMTPGTADDNLRLRAGSPAIDSARNGALPNDLLDLDGDGDTSERTPLDLGDDPRFMNDPLTVDTGNGDGAIVDRGAYEYANDCNRNGIPDPVELETQQATDCNNNGILDECDIADCPGTPDCDDCNLNGLPDACDIESGSSSDTDGNGIPDDCAFFVGGDGQWSFPGSWVNGRVPGPGVGAVTVQGIESTVFVDLPVSIDSLRILDGATVKVTSEETEADMFVNGTGGILNLGNLLVGYDRHIEVLEGPFVLGDGSTYRKDPMSFAFCTAQLIAGHVLMLPTTCGDDDQIVLSDGMRLETLQDFVMDGRGAFGCGTVAGGQTPPILRLIPNATMTVDGSIVIEDAAEVVVEPASTLTAGAPVETIIEFGRDFENRSMRPDLFYMRDAGLAMLGDGVFEVGGRDVGPFIDGFGNDTDQNFSLGSLQVGAGVSAAFGNSFVNTLGSGPCVEAQYVRRLVLGDGSQVLVDNVKVYYGTLELGKGVTVNEVGCGALIQYCPYSGQFFDNDDGTGRCTERDYMREVAAMQNCFTGDTGEELSACCAYFDFDGDNAVSQADHALLFGLIAGEGDCCTPGETCGCDRPDVQACVCELDPVCCQASWDEACVELAATCNACK